MAFTISLTTVTTNAEHVNVALSLSNRGNFGVIPYVEVFLESTPGMGTVSTYNKLTATSLEVDTPNNARYQITMYAFPTEANAAQIADSYRVDVTGSLQQYNGTQWANVEFDQFARAGASETSNTINQAILSHAYLLRNKLNLKYLAQVQKDVREGDAYTEMYYKRVDLDYTDALINAAEYNWSLGLNSNFYDICKELNKIEENYV